MRDAVPWVVVNSSSGTVERQQRVWLSIRWDQVPNGTATSSITFTGAGGHVTVEVDTLNPSEVSRASLLSGFSEGAGYHSPVCSSLGGSLVIQCRKSDL